MVSKLDMALLWRPAEKFAIAVLSTIDRRTASERALLVEDKPV